MSDRAAHPAVEPKISGMIPSANNATELVIRGR